MDEILDRTVVNTSAAQEHVAEIERQIRTTKERCLADVSTLPSEVIPRLIVINIVCFIGLWLNAFTVQNGVSEVYLPWSIVVHPKLSWKQHCKVLFGTYYKVHDEPDPSNDMTLQNHEGVALGYTENIQGTYKFFVLALV